MQKNFFEEKAISTSTDLIIGKKSEKILTKQQETFNRLIKKIEKLRVELVNLNKSLDEKLDFYVKHIYSVEQQLTELNKDIVRMLFIFFKNKKLLSKKERDSLGGVISAILEDIFNFVTDEPEEEFKQMFKAVQGISYEQAAEEDFDILKFKMESMFEQFGYDMNLDDLTSNMTREEMMQKTLELDEEFKKQAAEREQNQHTRKKSKKQLEKEEREKQAEEVRSKNISSIYKQLAKIFHPDLELDEEIKLQKEELMKQLTNAYENKDLHTLLRLELTWIQKEENNTDKLTDEKLNIYNQVLKEQILELEQEIDEMLLHPRYQPLQSFVIFPAEIRNLNLKSEKRGVENHAKTLVTDLARLRGSEQQALAEVRKRIREYNIESRQASDFAKFMGDF